jgi:Tfp pilus assembly protein PilV
MRPSRHGFVLLEVVVAFGLLAVLIAVCLQMLSATAAGRRAAERRAVALQEAANIMERIAAMPWDQITGERLQEIELSPSVREILPGAAVNLTTEAASDAGPPGKHVGLEITWTNAVGDRDAPVRLSYWTYASRRESSR